MWLPHLMMMMNSCVATATPLLIDVTKHLDVCKFIIFYWLLSVWGQCDRPHVLKARWTCVFLSAHLVRRALTGPTLTKPRPLGETGWVLAFTQQVQEDIWDVSDSPTTVIYNKRAMLVTNRNVYTYIYISCYWIIDHVVHRSTATSGGARPLM